jgi:hypothetical protein
MGGQQRCRAVSRRRHDIQPRDRLGYCALGENPHFRATRLQAMASERKKARSQNGGVRLGITQDGGEFSARGSCWRRTGTCACLRSPNPRRSCQARLCVPAPPLKASGGLSTPRRLRCWVWAGSSIVFSTHDFVAVRDKEEMKGTYKRSSGAHDGDPPASAGIIGARYGKTRRFGRWRGKKAGRVDRGGDSFEFETMANHFVTWETPSGDQGHGKRPSWFAGVPHRQLPNQRRSLDNLGRMRA